LRFVIDDLIEARKLAVTTVAAVIVLLTVIAVRLVAVYASFGRWRLMERWGASVLARSARLRARQTRRDQRRAGRAVLHAPTAKETLVVGWTGMRGIVTLAAAAAVPAGVLGRDAIQAVALFVTLGTLLLQGTTVTTLVRLLRIDVAAELHEAEDLLTRGNRIATDALSGAVASSDVDFEAQRAALSHAVAARELDDRTARELIHEIDLRQAAHEITA
jgi:NhaP-type Na+/H+ or K+/H+ antiporter